MLRIIYFDDINNMRIEGVFLFYFPYQKKTKQEGERHCRLPVSDTQQVNDELFFSKQL